MKNLEIQRTPSRNQKSKTEQSILQIQQEKKINQCHEIIALLLSKKEIRQVSNAETLQNTLQSNLVLQFFDYIYQYREQQKGELSKLLTEIEKEIIQHLDFKQLQPFAIILYTIYQKDKSLLKYKQELVQYFPHQNAQNEDLLTALKSSQTLQLILKQFFHDLQNNLFQIKRSQEFFNLTEKQQIQQIRAFCFIMRMIFVISKQQIQNDYNSFEIQGIQIIDSILFTIRCLPLKINGEFVDFLDTGISVAQKLKLGEEKSQIQQQIVEFIAELQEQLLQSQQTCYYQYINTMHQGQYLTYFYLRLIDVLNFTEQINSNNPTGSILNHLYQQPLQEYYLHLKRIRFINFHTIHFYQKLSKRVIKYIPSLELYVTNFFIQNYAKKIVPIIKSIPQNYLNYMEKNNYYPILKFQKDLKIDITDAVSQFIQNLIEQSVKNQLQIKNGSFIDPLVILMIKKKFFYESESQTLQILQCLLYLLQIWESNIKSKKVYIYQGETDQKKVYLKELKTTIIQGLMQLLKPDNYWKHNSNDNNYQKQKLKRDGSEKIICHFIHNFCIENDEIIRNIIEYGFSTHIIDKIVQNVEFMHVGLIQYKSLLENARTQEDQIFVFNFLTSLVTFYKIQQSSDVSQNLLTWYKHKFIGHPLPLSFFQNTVKCIEKIVKQYPHLEQQGNEIKQELNLYYYQSKNI